MKIFTKNYITWLILIMIFTLIHQIFFSKLLTEKSIVLAVIISSIYVILLASTTALFFSKDKYLFSIYSLKWGIGLFSAYELVRYFWILFGNPAPSQKIRPFLIVIIAVIYLFLYFIYKRTSIKGIGKSEIFD